jgi:hypothetical protein
VFAAAQAVEQAWIALGKACDTDEDETIDAKLSEQLITDACNHFDALPSFVRCALRPSLVCGQRLEYQY